MIVIRIFGIVLLLMGGFLAHGLLGSYRPIVFGTKTEATIVAVERFNNKRFTYVYYPVFQFAHQKKTIKVLDKFGGDVKENSVGLKAFIYYSKNYGISRGFTSSLIIFSIISVSFLSFGAVASFSSRKSLRYP